EARHGRDQHGRDESHTRPLHFQRCHTGPGTERPDEETQTVGHGQGRAHNKPISVNWLTPLLTTSSRRKASKAASLPTNPSSGGTPAIDARASAAIPASTGQRRPRPDRWRTSRVPARLSMMPVTRKSVDLNSPWERTSVAPANADTKPPDPIRTVRKPSWLTVPN